MCCVCPPLAASRSNSPMIKKRSQQRCEETPSSTDTASHDYWSITASLNRLHPPIAHGQSNLYTQVQCNLQYFIKLTMSLCSVLLLFLLPPPSSSTCPLILLSQYRFFLISQYRLFLISQYRIFLLSQYRIFLLSQYRIFLLSQYRIFLLSQYRFFLLSQYRILLISQSRISSFCNFLISACVSSPYWCNTLQLNIVTVHDIVSYLPV